MANTNGTSTSHSARNPAAARKPRKPRKAAPNAQTSLATEPSTSAPEASRVIQTTSAAARASAENRATVAAEKATAEAEDAKAAEWRGLLFNDPDRLEALYQNNDDFCQMLDGVMNEQEKERAEALAEQEALRKRFAALGLPFDAASASLGAAPKVRKPRGPNKVKTGNASKAAPKRVAVAVSDADLKKWFASVKGKLSEKAKNLKEFGAAMQDANMRNAAVDKGWLVVTRGRYGGAKLGSKTP